LQDALWGIFITVPPGHVHANKKIHEFPFLWLDAPHLWLYFIGIVKEMLMAANSAKKGLSKDDAAKKTKFRSPNYPVVGLRKALERASQLFSEYKHSAVPLGAIQEKWGYKPHSGAANQVVAALRAFDLVEIDGIGNRRLVRLSERGKKIVGDHPDRAKFLQECALWPAIYAELWEKYKEEGLPPDETIRAYLHWDRNFNPGSIDGIIADFRDTIALANLTPTGKIDSSGAGDSSGSGSGFFDRALGAFFSVPQAKGTQAKGQGESKEDRKPPEGARLPKGEPSMIPDTLTLEEGVVVFQYPRQLSAADYQDLEDWMKIQLRKIKRLIKADSQGSDKGQYTQTE
jgi:hypothetical protein